MEIRYVIKDFEGSKYYAGTEWGFNSSSYYADYFETIADAELLLSTLPSGVYQIEPVYINK